MKTLPLEQMVDCACNALLSRPVGMYALWSESRVAACLSCGKVECYRPEGDEPRGAGPVLGCNFLIPLPEEWYRWLGQWPRLLTWDIDRLVWAANALDTNALERLLRVFALERLDKQLSWVYPLRVGSQLVPTAQNRKSRIEEITNW